MFVRPKPKQLVFYLFLAIAVFIVSIWPIDYIIFLPGKALKLSEMISVPNAVVGENEGSLMMTVVLSQQANIPLFIRAMLDPSIDLYPMDEIIPPSFSSDQYHQVMLESMQSSQLTAAGVALRESGFEVRQSGEGVLVLTVLNESYAVDLLRPGDVIVACDGQAIQLFEDLQRVLADKKPGDIADLETHREGDQFAFEVELIPKSDLPEAGGIGFSGTTYNWKPELPIEVIVHSEDIGGASAGLMMAIEVMNQISTEDLTSGHLIAGTGTLAWNGKVGPIGGIRQKVMGAIDSKAEFFFSPTDNYYDAREAAENKLTVIEIAYIDDALAFLDSLK